MKYAMVQSIWKRCAWVGAALFLGACGEIAAPGDDIPTMSADMKDAPVGAVQQLAEAPLLTTYDTTFTVFQGSTNVATVCYQDLQAPCAADDTLSTGQEDTDSWFLKIKFHQSTQFIDPAGVSLAKGDSLQITMSIDSTSFVASFGPHGLVFDGPRQPVLRFRYRYADLTNKDPNDLGIWYQTVSGQEWAAQASVVEPVNETVSMDLYHFSNYALAF